MKRHSTEKAPWHNSKISCTSEKSDDFMTVQSQDPIISIDSDRKISKSNVSGTHHSGGHTHGIIPVEHPTSFLETFMHFLKGYVGSGIFAMGDGIKHGGLIFGPVVIVLLGIICTDCQQMLLSASTYLSEKKKLAVSPDFAETVELCFENGPPKFQNYAALMKKVVNVFLCITQIGFCCVYFMFISQNVQQLLDVHGLKLDVHFVMVIVLLPLLLISLIRNLKYLAPFSTVANLFTVTGISIVTYYSTQDIPSAEDKPWMAPLQDLPLFFGTVMYSFEGIGLIIPLRNEMKKPKKFSTPFGVLNVGMAITIILFTSVGLITYLKYGQDIKGSSTLNLPPHEWPAQCVRIMISCGISLSYALQLYIAVEILWPNVKERIRPTKYPVLSELAFRAFLVLFTFTLAEAIPFLAHFVSLVGSVSSTMLALIIPSIVDLITSASRHKLGTFTILKDSFIILLGVFGTFTGGYESILAIVNDFSTGG